MGSTRSFVVSLVVLETVSSRCRFEVFAEAVAEDNRVR
jgi:hypothetical protein